MFGSAKGMNIKVIITVEVAHKLDVPKMLLVVNKVLTEFDFSEVKKRVGETYSCEVAGKKIAWRHILSMQMSQKPQ